MHDVHITSVIQRCKSLYYSSVKFFICQYIDESYVLPSCVVNGTAISKTFQILYRNEDVAINDLVMYRLHTLVDANKVEELKLKENKSL